MKFRSVMRKRLAERQKRRVSVSLSRPYRTLAIRARDWHALPQEKRSHIMRVLLWAHHKAVDIYEGRA